MTKKNFLSVALITLALLVVLATHLYPLLKYGEGGLGYDTGFYRRYLQLETPGFIKPPAYILENNAWGTRVVLSALSHLPIKTNIALFGSYLLFSLFLGLAIYLLTGELFQNRRAGILALFLFALSSVQWLGFTFFFYKQFWAAPWLILAIYFFEKQSYFFILPLALSFFSHRTTAFLALPAFFLTNLWLLIKNSKFPQPGRRLGSEQRPASRRSVGTGLAWAVESEEPNRRPIVYKKNKKWLLAALSVPLIFSALWASRQSLFELFNILKNGVPAYDPFHFKTGLFIGLKNFWQMAALYLLPAGFGFWLLINSVRNSAATVKNNPDATKLKNTVLNGVRKCHFGVFFFFILTTTVLVIIQSYFYQRIIFFLDLTCLILAGGAIACFLEYFKNTRLAKVAVWLFFLFISLNLIYTIKNYEPLIGQNEINEIKKLSPAENEAFVMTDTPQYAPWLYGWAGPDKRVISPGLFWDRWTHDEWQIFWAGDINKQKEMLAQYRAPIYIFKPNYNYSNDACFEKFSEIIWKFKCY